MRVKGVKYSAREGGSMSTQCSLQVMPYRTVHLKLNVTPIYLTKNKAKTCPWVRKNSDHRNSDSQGGSSVYLKVTRERGGAWKTSNQFIVSLEHIA